MSKPGHEAPHFDNRDKSPPGQLSIDSELIAQREFGGQDVEPAIPEVVPAEPTPMFHPPESVATQIAVDRQEAEAEFDRKDPNYPVTAAQNRRDVGGSLLTGDDIEYRELSHIKPKPARRPRKDRRHLGPRQRLNADGPPPGVPDARKTY